MTLHNRQFPVSCTEGGKPETYPPLKETEEATSRKPGVLKALALRVLAGNRSGNPGETSANQLGNFSVSETARAFPLSEAEGRRIFEYRLTDHAAWLVVISGDDAEGVERSLRNRFGERFVFVRPYRRRAT